MSVADILVVEDNRHDVAMILDAFCERYNPEKICILRNGAEAIDYFFGSQGRLQRADICNPKFILLDLKLPKISGLEVLKCLKSDERTRDIPTIIFTSSNEARDRSECYQMGANSYIVKPLDADCFSRFVTDIGSYWLMMNKTSYQER